MEDELLLSYENKLKLIEKLQQQVEQESRLREQERSKVSLAIKEFFKSGKSISEIAAISNMSEQDVWKIING